MISQLELLLQVSMKTLCLENSQANLASSLTEHSLAIT